MECDSDGHAAAQQQGSKSFSSSGSGARANTLSMTAGPTGECTTLTFLRTHRPACFLKSSETQHFRDTGLL